MSYNILSFILEKQYDELSIKDINTIAKYPEVFGLGSEFKKIISAVNENNYDEHKDEVISYINKNILPRFEILSRLDKENINEENLRVSFKDNFYNNLNKMDIIQICILLDQIGVYIKNISKYKYNFFGPKYKIAEFYHEINMIASKACGASMAFIIFSRDNRLRFLKTNYSNYNKEDIINCLKKRVVHNYYILEAISNIVLELDSNDVLSEGYKLKLTRKINKVSKLYKDIVEEHKKKNRLDNIQSLDIGSLGMVIDELYEQPGEEDD